MQKCTCECIYFLLIFSLCILFLLVLGTYQSSFGSIDCLTCPMRSYCPSNTSNPFPCPPYSYCPNGTSNPILCPNGTYTDSTTTGLANPEDCFYCPAGQWQHAIYTWHQVLQKQCTVSHPFCALAVLTYSPLLRSGSRYRFAKRPLITWLKHLLSTTFVNCLI